MICLHSAFCILNYGLPANAQQLIDRVLARVGTSAVTMTDVRVATELGLVEIGPGEDREAAGLQRAIDRQLILAEVARFSPPEPAADAVAAEVAEMKSRAGAGYNQLAASTGLDDKRLQLLARETLRIRAYTAQRFGGSVQVGEEEARRYYDEHGAEFTRNGVRAPFEDVEAAARQAAAAARLRATIEQWLRDLRLRSEVVVVGGRP